MGTMLLVHPPGGSREGARPGLGCCSVFDYEGASDGLERLLNLTDVGAVSWVGEPADGALA